MVISPGKQHFAAVSKAFAGPLFLFRMKALSWSVSRVSFPPLHPTFQTPQNPRHPLTSAHTTMCQPQRCKSELHSTLALRQDVLSVTRRQRTSSYNERCHSVTCSKPGASHGRIGVWKECRRAAHMHGNSLLSTYYLSRLLLELSTN